jgi:hypothetical protein
MEMVLPDHKAIYFHATSFRTGTALIAMGWDGMGWSGTGEKLLPDFSEWDY